jgi:zinc transporter 1/2/3
VAESQLIYSQLLAPASHALMNPCLTGPITQYDWVEGIALITVFLLFFTELMAMRFSTFGHTHDDDNHDELNPIGERAQSTSSHGHAPGDDHLSHSRDHVDPDVEEHRGKPVEDFAAQMTAIFILEFGVVFHSVFVGLTLAVAGAEFNTLYVVLVFHQTFEGLGLGSRLAVTPWPKSKRWTPYIFALVYGFSTPIALAVGLGIRNTYVPGSQTALIVNGVFDSISAGILIYTGLVELMAHEFMFSSVMRRARLRVVLSAFGMMCLGAGKSWKPWA